MGQERHTKMGSSFRHRNWGGNFKIEEVDEETIKAILHSVQDEWDIDSVGRVYTLPRTDLVYFERMVEVV